MHCGEHRGSYPVRSELGSGDSLEISGGTQWYNAVVNCRAGYYVRPEDARYPMREGTFDEQIYDTIVNNMREGIQRIWQAPSAKRLF